MKKLLALMLGASLGIAMAGCASKEEPGQNSSVSDKLKNEEKPGGAATTDNPTASPKDNNATGTGM